MSDERFEEFLKREAAAYQPPPAVTPRDEMWAVIAEARAARGGRTGRPIGVTPTRPRPLRYTPWIGMAATLLLGVGIGRYALRETAPTAAPIAEATLPTDRSPAVPAVREVPATSTVPATAPAGDRESPARAVPTPQRNPVRLASNDGFTGGAVNPMQVASSEHLARAEALISVIAATPADAVMDSLTNRWAREMLTNTRLLLDSPAGDDPARRRLFEDLEMILVQLVQRSGTSVNERLFIDRSLQRTQLLTRLRASATGI